MSGVDSSPGATGEESLSPLEQEVLDEYVRLAGNLGDVSFDFSSDIRDFIRPSSKILHPAQITLLQLLLDDISKAQRRQQQLTRTIAFCTP